MWVPMFAAGACRTKLACTAAAGAAVQTLQPLIHVVKSLCGCHRGLLSRWSESPCTSFSLFLSNYWCSVSLCTAKGVCPLLDKCHLGSSGMRKSVTTCRKPAGRAGAFNIFMVSFTRMERGSSEAFWVTGNETGFREICTADTPATEVLLSHVRTHKYTALLAHLQTRKAPFWHGVQLNGYF